MLLRSVLSPVSTTMFLAKDDGDAFGGRPRVPPSGSEGYAHDGLVWIPVRARHVHTANLDIGAVLEFELVARVQFVSTFDRFHVIDVLSGVNAGNSSGSCCGSRDGWFTHPATSLGALPFRTARAL